MKKLILIIICILMCGCDYKELNNLGIITMMTIDYDKKYIVNIEILDNNKNSKNKSLILSGQGVSIDKAISDAKNKSEYELSYSHVYVIILGNNLLKKDTFDDYLIRNKDLRKDFYILYSDNINKILKYSANNKQSSGEAIYKTIKNNNTFITNIYRDIIHSKLNNTSYYIGNIDIKNNELYFGKPYICYNKKHHLINRKYTFLYALINKKIKTFDIETNNIYKAYNYKIKTKVNNNKLIIKIKPNIKIININKGNIMTYRGIKKEEQKINKLLQKKVNSIIDYSYKTNIDFNNLSYLYYTYSNEIKKLDDIKVVVIVDCKLNEKGLTLKGFKK